MRPDQRYAKRPASRQAAIAAKCYDCVGKGQDRGWQNTIGLCSVNTCPLHPFRPYQNRTATPLAAGGSGKQILEENPPSAEKK